MPKLIHFEVTYEWAGSSGSNYMSTDIVRNAVDEADARKKFAQRHDGERHKIMEVRNVGSNDTDA
jgi:hypothetical protein